MNRKEKQQARAERYEELARKAETQSTQAWEKSHEMVSHIPMGQPILVGHHSERGHRRLLDRSWNKMGESVKLGEKADYYRQKAEAAANNDAIYTGDDDAEERLKEKIAKLEQLQEQRRTKSSVTRKQRNRRKSHSCRSWEYPKPMQRNCLIRIGSKGWDSLRSVCKTTGLASERPN